MKDLKAIQSGKITIICETASEELVKSALEKGIGEKIVITGEVVASDCVNGYTVVVKKLR